MKNNQSLLALACGDSYGSYYESYGLMGVKYDISELPDKPVQKQITDDTKMATILLEHYRRHQTLKTDFLLKNYKHWARTEGYQDGIGMHTYDALIKNQKNKDSQGNGALMRVIPFGIELIKDDYNFDKVVEMMNIDSALTHENEIIFLSNRLCLDIALNGMTVLEKQEYKKLLSKLKSGYTAWVIHTLYIVIKALKQSFSFVDGFKYIVSMGGDTDTNCAIYGAIKGCSNNIENELNIKEFLP